MGKKVSQGKIPCEGLYQNTQALVKGLCKCVAVKSHLHHAAISEIVGHE